VKNVSRDAEFKYVHEEGECQFVGRVANLKFELDRSHCCVTAVVRKDFRSLQLASGNEVATIPLKSSELRQAFC
jgi:hypothetical protein